MFEPKNGNIIRDWEVYLQNKFENEFMGKYSNVNLYELIDILKEDMENKFVSIELNLFDRDGKRVKDITEDEAKGYVIWIGNDLYKANIL